MGGDKIMSYFINLKSACGRKSSSVDVQDLELNPHGVVCCVECETIIESRNAWNNYVKEWTTK